MRLSRAYRKQVGLPAAIDELNKNKNKNKGVLYDPNVVGACYPLYKSNKLNCSHEENLQEENRGKS